MYKAGHGDNRAEARDENKFTSELNRFVARDMIQLEIKSLARIQALAAKLLKALSVPGGFICSRGNVGYWRRVYKFCFCLISAYQKKPSPHL